MWADLLTGHCPWDLGFKFCLESFTFILQEDLDQAVRAECRKTGLFQDLQEKQDMIALCLDTQSTGKSELRKGLGPGDAA